MSNKILFHNANLVLKKFQESKGKKILDGVKVYRKINCVESKKFGNELRFQIPRIGNQLLQDIRLRVDLPAFSGFSGGSYVRFVNNVLLRMFSKMELWSGGQQILQRYSDEVTYNILPNIEYEKWQKMASDIAATRNTLGASA